MRAINDRTRQPAAGIFYCAGALLAFAVQDAMVKALTARYAVLEILTLRTGVVFVLLTAVGLVFYGARILRTNRPWPLLARGVLAFFAFTTYYFALARIPLADGAAVFMTGPLFVTLLSVPLLGERVGWHRWGAIGFGFVAVIVILNPGSDLFQAAAALPLMSAVAYAMIPIITRRMGVSQHVLTMAIYTTTSYLALCFVASAVVEFAAPPADGAGLLGLVLQRWHWPSPRDLITIAVAGCFFVLGLLGLTQAYRIAAVSFVAPAEYSYLVWTSLLGFAVFGDVPGVRVIAGSAMVVAAGCYVMYRERRRDRARSLED